MSDADTESPLDEESSDVFEPDQESSLIDDETDVVVHESKEEALRRKKIRRLLERQLERKRLREELDDFIDLDEENDGLEGDSLEEDDEDDLHK